MSITVSIHNPRPHRIATLIQRRLLMFYRDRTDVSITFLQAPLLVISFFLVFQEIVGISENNFFQPLRDYLTSDTVSVIIFLLVLSAIWFGTAKSIIEIPSFKKNYEQEKLSFLSDFDFIFANFIFLSFIAFLQVVLFTVTFHILFIFLPAWFNPFSTGLVLTENEPISLSSAAMVPLWFKFTLLMSLISTASVAFTLLISILIPTRSAANAILPFILIIQILIGGSLIKPVIHMSPTVQYFSNIMISRWGFESVLLLFERDLNLEMPRAQFKHEEQFDFTSKNFVGVAALSLRSLNPHHYVDCLHDNWLKRLKIYQEKEQKEINTDFLIESCDGKNITVVYQSYPDIVIQHDEILKIWSQALDIVINDEEYINNEDLRAYNDKILNYFNQLTESVDNDIQKLKALKSELLNQKLSIDILQRISDEFYGESGLYRNKVRDILISPENQLTAVDTIILAHAMKNDDHLRLFRTVNFQITWLMLLFITIFSILLSWIFIKLKFTINKRKFT